MHHRRFAGTAAAAVVVVVAAAGARAATNDFPVTHAAVSVRAIAPNDLKPSECAGITVTRIIIGSGNFNGGPQSELIIGSAAADTIQAKNGDDCVVAGAGDDVIDGGPATDVCLGGPDTDSFDQCETVWP